MSLLSRLNQNLGKTPDEIVAAITDPLSKWQSMSTFITEQNYDGIRHRDVLMYSVQGGDQSFTGYYCCQREHMSERWSYRTDDVIFAEPQNLENYPPEDARDCGGWWIIGIEHGHVSLPVTQADPSQDNPYEDNYYDDGDY